MVSESRPALVLQMLVLLALLLPSFAGVRAQAITYRVDKEYVKIWVNQDGTIDVLYDIKITCLSGRISGFYVGMPNRDFKVGRAEDASGAELDAADASSGDDYRVDVTLLKPLDAGEGAEFTLLANVAGMVFEDNANPGNYGLQFTASWFEDAVVEDLRILVVLPPGAEPESIRCTPDWSSPPIHDPGEEGRLAVYWENRGLEQGERFTVGLSFPSSLMPNYKPEVGPSGLLQKLAKWLGSMTPAGIFGLFVAFAAAFAVLSATVPKFLRRAYVRPELKIESMGVKAGLTAVESAQLLGMPPQKVSVAILYGLLLKRAVWVEGVEPNLSLRVSESLPELRYYEKDFIDAIKPDGRLSEEGLARTIMRLRDAVDAKVKGYCREDTVNYYRSVVEKAWKQVEAAQTPELASRFFNENLLWLMLDDRYADRTREKFSPIVFIPGPDWWWHYNARYLPPLPAPSETAEPTVPGAEFANSVAAALESTSSKLVSDVEKFTKSILPPPPDAKSQKPVHHKANCVCACASCACACACVSCACACASGGAH